ncbi:MAG: BlaI/MecI/CopY family transcriptional regulator [Cellvibrionaceae bacterium]|nr:BlaI/MecI/CopY family transcriptional regulator [Cellvibrionaceae bacterium]
MKSIHLGLRQLINKPLKPRAPILGERELEVMKILWREGAHSAQEVLRLSEEPRPSLSTMQSTLERLHRKQLLSRQKIGRSYRYRACVSRSAIIGQLIGDIAKQFGEGDIAPMISGFISYMDQESGSEADKPALPKSVRNAMQAFSETDND